LSFKARPAILHGIPILALGMVLVWLAIGIVWVCAEHKKDRPRDLGQEQGSAHRKGFKQP